MVQWDQKNLGLKSANKERRRIYLADSPAPHKVASTFWKGERWCIITVVVIVINTIVICLYLVHCFSVIIADMLLWRILFMFRGSFTDCMVVWLWVWNCSCWVLCSGVVWHCSHRLVDIVGKLGETRKMGAGYIVWQEVFDNNVKVTVCLSVSLFVPLCVTLVSVYMFLLLCLFLSL